MIRAMSLCVVIVIIAGVAFGQTSRADNKTLNQRFYDEVVNGGNYDLIDELIADDFVEHEVFPGLTPNREGVKQFFMMIRKAFPDLKFEVEFMIAENDMVASYIKMSGTQKGDFMGMSATGNYFEAHTVDIIRMKDGKAVEHWGVTDGMSMMEQLTGKTPEGD